MDTPIRLPEDFKEFLRLLQASEAEYLLVGGYAVGFYGYPRPTGDMDIWISNSSENASRLLKVFNDFGFDSPDLTAASFCKPKSIVRVGIAPFKIEVITHIDGVRFEECFPRRKKAEIDGCVVNIIDLSDLLTNKKASARPKDLDDLIELERVNRQS